MKKLALCVAFIALFVTQAFADQYVPAPIVPTQPYATILSPGACLTATLACVVSGGVDPTVFGATAPQGSIYLSTATRAAYVKQDNGFSLNWLLLVPAGASSGTVTSVGLVLPASVFTVTGSPVTTTGTLTGSLASQPANFAWLGPVSGPNAPPIFRAIGVSDLPVSNLTEMTSDVLTITGGTNAVIGTGTTVQVSQAGSSSDGYLSSTDWNTFNNKQAGGSYISALTSDVSATGPGSATATIQPNVVTNSKLAQMPGNTVKANTTGSTADAYDVGLGTASEAVSNVLVLSGWQDATIGSPTIQVEQSSGAQSGYLSSTDWSTFNNKQSAGNYITALTGDVVAAGPGSAAATIQPNSVTNAKLATMVTNTVKGNTSGITTNPSDLALGNVTVPSILNVSGGTSAVIGSGVSITLANESVNTFLAGPTSGPPATPFFRTIAPGDVPTLNQNTTGMASNVTGVVAFANGGTGQTTQQAALNALAVTQTSGQYLRGNGTNVVMSSIQVSDVPTLNQNTTGNAATATTATTAGNVTGIVAVLNGGTGQTTANAGYNALSPMTTLGDIPYENAVPAAARLAGNTSTTKNFLTQTGTGVISAAPSWGAIASGDLPTITLTGNVTGSGSGGSIVTTIANNAVTNAMLTQAPQFTLKGNNTSGTANETDLTVSQVNAMLGNTGSVGTFDGHASSPNGATISSGVIYFQSAGTNPGMVNATTQTLVGAKSFSSPLTLSGTAGNGYENFIAQSSGPSTPASGANLYANSSNKLAWIGADGNTRNLDIFAGDFGSGGTNGLVPAPPASSGTTEFLKANSSWANAVTSIGVSVPGIIYSVAGSPVTTSGTITLSALVQNANTILAGPASGSAATPSFRAQMIADNIPLQIAYFADGSDGSVTANAGTTTLSRDMYYTNLTINGTGSINTAGYRIWVTGTLDITAAPTNGIVCNGGNGGAANGQTSAGAAGSVSANTGSVGGSGAGTIGAVSSTTTGTEAAAPTNQTPSNGGNGGNGAAGGAGAGGTNAGGIGRPGATGTNGMAIRRWNPEYVLGGSALLGGAGGAGGSGAGGDGTVKGGYGGGGGGGGCVIFISAANINRGASTAAGAISSNGGMGGNGGTAVTGTNPGGGGAGAGGGGGVVYIAYGNLLGSSAPNAIAVSGGAGGNGGNAEGTGEGGNGGGAGAGGMVTLLNFNSGLVTVNTGPARVVGGAASGTTGGTGASMNTYQVSL